ncbi:hypothetical protein BaRGS_00025621, partial [Batillaria attramentaria]
MKGADFSIVQEGDAGLNSITLGVSDADFQITFRPFDYDGKMKAQKKAGITVTCPETVLHDILLSDTQQTNPQCEIASNILQKRCKGDKKADALKACSPLVNYGKHT